VTLNWKPPVKDGGSVVTNYIVEYRDAKRTTWSKAGDVSADKTFFVADRLITGNDYYFRVIAVNDEGQGQPLESVTTVRPEQAIGKLDPISYVIVLLSNAQLLLCARYN
jgi:titin